jgi:hypothetical protein
VNFCSGKMADGKRNCYFKGVHFLRGKWYCKKCYRARTKSISTVPDKRDREELITKKELDALYQRYKRYVKGDPVVLTSTELRKIFPRLMQETMRLKGMSF